MTEKKAEISCPQCKKKCEYNIKNKYRPFCSKRCYDLDLINWHDEEYAIKGEKATDDDLLRKIKGKKSE